MHFLRVIIIVVSVGGALSAVAQPPAIFGPGVISGPVNDDAPAFSPDGQTVYFQRRGPGFTGTILVSHLRHGQWSTPAVASFSGEWQDIEPAMAPDGSYLIFSSNRPVVVGGHALNGAWSGQRFPGRGGNLWRVDRKGDGWSQPVRLPEIVNSDSSVFSPAITADGSLYFMKPFEDTGKFHLYRSAYLNGRYETPLRLSFSMVDSIGDYDPAVAPNDSFLVFCSGRPPATHTELWIVFRDHGSWGNPVSLGPEVNRGVSNIEARLSPDHRLLYFSSFYVEQPAELPTRPSEREEAVKRSDWNTGMSNIWFVPLDRWLGADR